MSNKIDIYLNFFENTEEVFNFYKLVFGGEFLALQRFKEIPGAEFSAADGEKVMHVSLQIGDGVRLMGTDLLQSRGDVFAPGNNFSISISPDSKEEATCLFNALAEGGSVSMPLQDVFWGAYYGILTDKFGIQWMINYQYS